MVGVVPILRALVSLGAPALGVIHLWPALFSFVYRATDTAFVVLSESSLAWMVAAFVGHAALLAWLYRRLGCGAVATENEQG